MVVLICFTPIISGCCWLNRWSPHMFVSNSSLCAPSPEQKSFTLCAVQPQWPTWSQSSVIRRLKAFTRVKWWRVEFSSNRLSSEHSFIHPFFLAPEKMFASVVFHLNPTFPVSAQQQLHTFGFTLGDLSWHTEATVLAEWCKRATIFVKTKFNKNQPKCTLTVTFVPWFRNPSLFLSVSPFPSLSNLLYLLQRPYHGRGHGQSQKLNARMA